MTNIERLKAMSLEELAEWLDENGMFDGSPWNTWFTNRYCENCESIECKYDRAKTDLGITPFYDETIECAYCELADESGIKRCRFFPELDDIPNNKKIIEMWLIEEVDNEQV